jgi:hypothetical protein
MIRKQIESMDDITAIDDEVRGIVERNWPHLMGSQTVRPSWEMFIRLVVRFFPPIRTPSQVIGRSIWNRF